MKSIFPSTSPSAPRDWKTSLGNIVAERVTWFGRQVGWRDESGAEGEGAGGVAERSAEF